MKTITASGLDLGCHTASEPEHLMDLRLPSTRPRESGYRLPTVAGHHRHLHTFVVDCTCSLSTARTSSTPCPRIQPYADDSTVITLPNLTQDQRCGGEPRDRPPPTPTWGSGLPRQHASGISGRPSFQRSHHRRLLQTARCSPDPTQAIGTRTVGVTQTPLRVQ